MAHPYLTEYLLALATDPEKLEEYNAADDEQREALAEAAGLTAQQSEALESAESPRIMDEVLKELDHHHHHRHRIPAYTIQLHLELRPCKKPPG